MHVGRTVFSHLMDFVPRHEFPQIVRRYKGEQRVRRFSCWDQFLSIAFAQLTYRESLRDIKACLRSLGPVLYHAGIRAQVSCSTLAYMRLKPYTDCRGTRKHLNGGNRLQAADLKHLLNDWLVTCLK